MVSPFVMLVVSVPEKDAEALRKAIREAGGGRLGAYSHCSFSYTGTGRFLPGEGASPTYGKRGELTAVPEERIEVLCERANITQVIAAIRRVHPYEEPAFHYFPVEIE